MEHLGLDEPRLAAMARALGRRLRPGDVVLLEGPMGAGKTTFTRALAAGLGVVRPERVRSPTYTLCLLHDGPRPLAHVDLFRLAGEDEPSPGSVSAAAFEALGLAELSEGPNVVLVVEWGDLWADPPESHLRVRLALDPDQASHRALGVDAVGERAQALQEAWEGEIGAMGAREFAP